MCTVHVHTRQQKIIKYSRSICPNEQTDICAGSGWESTQPTRRRRHKIYLWMCVDLIRFFFLSWSLHISLPLKTGPNLAVGTRTLQYDPCENIHTMWRAICFNSLHCFLQIAWRNENNRVRWDDDHGTLFSSCCSLHSGSLLLPKWQINAAAHRTLQSIYVFRWAAVRNTNLAAENTDKFFSNFFSNASGFYS